MPLPERRNETVIESLLSTDESARKLIGGFVLPAPVKL
jgi:hypothetical protein